ncbi:unnamed protein product [Ceutorhynchus assimilis]|uniref:Uncharacterized protein n=1 Tax=Ceutorhynchus assimilis TaxID=467358 RepID=A0A9N9MGR3_9CUCU|nr:unnamed protein product [Ceutorhynchus assimilis]
MKNIGNQPIITDLVENTVSHISKFSWKTSEGKILELFACKEESEKLIFLKFQIFPVENSNMKNLGNQPTKTELVENTVSHISKFSWKTSEGKILTLFACKGESEKLIFSKFQISPVKNNNMKNIGNQATITNLVENTVSHISKFSWKTSEGKILELFACKEESEKLIFLKFQIFPVENSNMKNLGNQPTKTELVENTVSHISKFSWKTSEGKILTLFACKGEGEKLIFPKFQISPVKNNNMKNIGNQPTITNLVENTVSHISKFSWKTSEGKILELFACKEESEKLIFLKFQIFPVENSNMKNLGNQPTKTELVENTVSHISKFSWKTSEGKILTLFACKGEGEELIFPKFQISPVKNNNMKNIGNQATITNLVENTVSHISKFSWKTSEGKILELFACKEESEKLIFLKFQIFPVENSNMKNLGNQPTKTELVENTVSHISKFSWKTSEGKILTLFACKGEGEKLIFPKFQISPVKNNNMKNIGNQATITNLVENTVSHISKFSWKTSEGKILELFACKEESEKLIFLKFQIFPVENSNMKNLGNQPTKTELVENTVSHISKFSWKTSEGKILTLFACKGEGEKLIFPKFQISPVKNNNMKNIGNQATITNLVENTVSHISKFSWKTSEGKILELFACKEESEKLIFLKFQIFPVENSNMKNLGNQPTKTELVENTVSHISKFSWKTSEGKILTLFACKGEGEELIFPKFQISPVKNNNMKNIGNQATITNLVENTVSHISKFSWKTSEGKILELFACKEESEKLIFLKFQIFPVENSNMKNLGNQPTKTELVENTVSHISKFSWKTSEGKILTLFACKGEGEELIFPKFQISPVKNNNMKNIGNQATITNLVENTVSHISKFSWKTSEGKILELFACKEESEKLIFLKFQIFPVENSNMKNLGNQPTKTELVENTVSHISKFSWKTSEGKILTLFACKGEGEELIFPKFQISPVKNNNMKNIGNQATITNLVENTVSHISKFSWKTSEGKILELFACKEESEKLIFLKFQIFPVENSNMKNLGNQPTKTELVENTVSHISKFSWKTSEGKILTLFACKGEGEELIFPKFQISPVKNNNMKNIGNQATITNLVENTVSHISKFSWKTSEGKILELFACKEESEKLIFLKFQIFPVENSNMKNLGNQPTKTELVENTVSHISKFSWKTSEGKILTLFASKGEGEKLIFPKFQISPVKNNNMKNIGNQATITNLVENTVSHISKFSWKTSEGKILELFACKEEKKKSSSDDGHARYRPDRLRLPLSAPGPGMDGNDFPSAPQRGPISGPVPINIPLIALRPSSPPPLTSVSLTVPRPEAERRDNEYVETPLRGPLTAASSPAPVHRLPAPAPPQGPISKQPISFSKTSSQAVPAACANSRPSIMCTVCGRCKCATCRAPKPLPQYWSCNGACLLSADTIVDYASCLCCVKGLFYHCSEADDVENTAADDPCSCGPDRRFARWSCLAGIACVLPCLWLYWPLRGAKRAVELCYERHSRSGCRCRPPKQPPRPPPDKRLLGNDSLQDF